MTAGVIVLAIGLAASSSAMAGGLVAITSPVDGGAHTAGFHGPLAVDFTGVPTTGTYTLKVAGPGAYSWQTTWDYDGSQATNSWTFDPVSARGTYTATVEAPDNSTAATTTFHVDAVALSSSVSPSVVFPLERDGHRDFAHILFRTDVAAKDTVRVTNHRGKVIRTAALGRLRGGKVHEWRWNGKKNSGRKVNPGQFSVRVTAVRGVAVERGTPRTVEVAALPVHITYRSVQPQKFSPLVQDGVADTMRFRFATDVAAIDTIRLVNHRDKPIRTIRLGKLSGHHHHGWTWNGRNQRGRLVSPGSYRIKVTAAHYNHTTTSAWLRITVTRKPPSGGGGGGGGGGACTPGYSPCLVDHNGADYDCAGGSGNGPFWTEPGRVYSVTGSDPYGLDGDNDGRGCE